MPSRSEAKYTIRDGKSNAFFTQKDMNMAVQPGPDDLIDLDGLPIGSLSGRLAANLERSG
jgi:hypothetical protein